ncbi:MAG TPA: nickel pincer cofactor biosynthesis protein LarC [Nitrospirota bacterium]|nr:nickel pincer cofactor biosynthesis protein LarC [Nitrospirota bacterium]
MTLVYFDCFSGISGDMTLGALVDAGAGIDALREELAKLGLPGYELKSEKVTRSGIAATKVTVAIERKDQPSRHLADILKIIDRSSLSASIKEKSGLIFRRMAEAEARVHATSPDKVHFHEVGAIDAVVDIVGSVIGLELLGITSVIASPVNTGSGTVRTSHGTFPVPAPATADLLKGMPMYQSSTHFELATPTGAAIVSTLASSFGPLPLMKVDRIAHGAGDKDFPDHPNILRLMIGEPVSTYEEDTSLLIETNIDDMNPQIYDHLIDRLLHAGAHDAYLTPVIMKKGRPAILVSVLTDRTGQDAVLEVLFRETTSIGVRIGEVGRKKLSREIREVKTSYGTVRVKISKRGDEVLTATPEYDDCRKIAEEKHVPLKQVIEEAKSTFISRRAAEDAERR